LTSVFSQNNELAYQIVQKLYKYFSDCVDESI